MVAAPKSSELLASRIPLGERSPGVEPVPWPRTDGSRSCQTGSIFHEPEGLAEPRARLSNHNGPLCGGLAWTHLRAWPLGWGGPSFLICSQTQLPDNSS